MWWERGLYAAGSDVLPCCRLGQRSGRCCYKLAASAEVRLKCRLSVERHKTVSIRLHNTTQHNTTQAGGRVWGVGRRRAVGKKTVSIRLHNTHGSLSVAARGLGGGGGGGGGGGARGSHPHDVAARGLGAGVGVLTPAM